MPRLEPMATSASRGGRRARGARVSSSLAEINVVPLVDVMLVLLVIFMVAAPMMQQGFPVNLPQSRQSRAVTAPITVTVPRSFRTDRRVQIGDEWISFAVLQERIRQAVDARGSKRVIVAGDGALTLTELSMVLDKLNEGGVENASIQTQPATGDGR
jgi:biopolymer transport protein TolR